MKNTVPNRDLSKVIQGLPANPQAILEDARTAPADAVLALAAMCCVCKRLDAGAVRACRKIECPAHFRRPYQFDVPPRGAPHLERVDPNPEWGDG